MIGNLADRRPNAEEYLTEQELHDRFRIPPRTAQRWRVTGEGPPFVRIGKRRILYCGADVHTWMAHRTFASRAAELAQQASV